jgi:hypothetical protein
VAEWFARLAAALEPARPPSLVDLRVVRGVVLAGWERGEDFEVVATPRAGRWELALVDAAGAERYRAELRAEDGASDGPADPPGAPGEPGEPLAEPYAPGALFHRGPFQVLTDVVLRGLDRGSAAVRGCAAAGWPAERWRTDPAALDGGLQLALLAGQRAGLGPTLPLRVGRLAWDDLAGSATWCEVRARSRTAERLVCDLTFTDPGGRPVGSLRGVEMYRVAPESVS